MIAGNRMRRALRAHPEGVRGALRAHPVAVDAAVAVVALTVTWLVLQLQLSPKNPVTPLPATVVVSLTCLPVALRRRWPFAVVAATLAGTVAATILAAGAPLIPTGLGVALYTVTVRADRRTALRTFGAAFAVLAVTLILVSPRDVIVAALIGAFTGLGMFGAVGFAVHNRRAYVAAIEERALRAERTREDEARRRVAEERLRIARELHDVVAHHVAVVSVQTGLASHLLDDRPDAAREALGHVRRASAAILDELAGILRVLREPGTPAGPEAPAGGLAQLESLVESYAAAGLRIQWSLTGQPQALAATVDMVAYRVLQEALTNAHKHGTGTARIAVTYGGPTVRIDVSNPRPSAVGPNGTGYGLIGMRERAAAVGGTVEATVDSDGLFRVAATLPVHAGEPGPH